MNVLAFVLDYRSKRLYYGTNPGKAIKGNLRYTDLIQFLQN